MMPLPLPSDSATLDVQRSTVLRNTYLMLALTMVPTLLGAYIGVHLDFSFMAVNPVISFVGVLAVLFGMTYVVGALRNSAWGVAALLSMTGALGVLLGPILQIAFARANGAELVLMAGTGTAAIFLTMAGIAMTSKRDFSFLGNFLMVGLVLLILATLANMFLQLPALELTLATVGVALFSLYALHDVSRVVNGGETNYIVAAMSIYLDIFNLFTSLLRLLLSLEEQ